MLAQDILVMGPDGIGQHRPTSTFNEAMIQDPDSLHIPSAMAADTLKAS